MIDEAFSLPFPFVISFAFLFFTQDQFERVILNVYVKPEQNVVSYLTPLTGYAFSTRNLTMII